MQHILELRTLQFGTSPFYNTIFFAFEHMLNFAGKTFKLQSIQNYTNYTFNYSLIHQIVKDYSYKFRLVSEHMNLL